jgi:hypothetical protein
MVFRNLTKIHLLGLLFFLAAITLFIGFYFVRICRINKEYYAKNNFNDKQIVALRKFPYPYRAAMTICSDIDRTETLEEFLEIQKFINTREITSMGEGVGLDLGNSFLMYETPNSTISYFNSEPAVAGNILKLIKKGRIDVIHSFGKKSDFTREDAIKAIDELDNQNSNIDVWIDHTKSIDNMGDDVTFGLGDHADSNAYHADLTLAYGIKFLWLGRVTMVVGQSVPVAWRNFLSVYDSNFPFYSFLNLTKELTKHVLAVFGNKKYALHRDNDLVRITRLDDGQKVYEFIRFDNYWRGVGTGANCKNLAYVISKKTLERLKETAGYMVVYTHLGMNDECSQFICQDTQLALQNLAQENKAGNIFVTTTSKLLNYYIRHKYLNWSYKSTGDEITIQIHNVQDPIFGSYVPSVQQLEGFTFYVPDNYNAKILVNNEKITDVRQNPGDYSKRKSYTIFPHFKFSQIDQNETVVFLSRSTLSIKP